MFILPDFEPLELVGEPKALTTDQAKKKVGNSEDFVY